MTSYSGGHRHGHEAVEAPQEVACPRSDSVSRDAVASTTGDFGRRGPDAMTDSSNPALTHLSCVASVSQLWANPWAAVVAMPLEVPCLVAPDHALANPFDRVPVDRRADRSASEREEPAGGL